MQCLKALLRSRNTTGLLALSLIGTVVLCPLCLGCNHPTGQVRRQQDAESTPESKVVLNISDSERMTFVRIPAGKVEIVSRNSSGDPETHVFEVEQSFYLSQYEVTRSQWETIMGTLPSEDRGDLLPVTEASWEEAEEFCSRFSNQVGRQVYLPLAEEWYFAYALGRIGLAAGTTEPVCLSAKQANLVPGPDARDEPMAKPVTETTQDHMGLFGMEANAAEWCADWIRVEHGTHSELLPYRIAQLPAENPSFFPPYLPMPVGGEREPASGLRLVFGGDAGERSAAAKRLGADPESLRRTNRTIVGCVTLSAQAPRAEIPYYGSIELVDLAQAKGEVTLRYSGSDYTVTQGQQIRGKGLKVESVSAQEVVIQWTMSSSGRVFIRNE